MAKPNIIIVVYSCVYCDNYYLKLIKYSVTSTMGIKSQLNMQYKFSDILNIRILFGYITKY